MKRFLIIFSIILLAAHLAGCQATKDWTVRTEKVYKERVDQQLAGNRGFVFGTPTSVPQTPAFNERKIYKIEIEIPPSRKSQKWNLNRRQPESSKKNTLGWGNKGYLFGGTKEEETIATIQPVLSEPMDVEKALEEKNEPLHTYQVQKGDTLQKISQKFYETTRRWPVLYQANKNILKDSDKVYPGQVLVIPQATEYIK